MCPGLSCSAVVLCRTLPCSALLCRAVPCRQGTCTACCAKILSGRVSQPKQTCIPAQLLKEGYVALCCATPASDVKIQTHQGPAVKRWKADQANK
jgi:ferredoxin